ncbi:MAG: phage holin family protein [Flavobacteriia bacterium]|nr:phage holin family protein [Flavobacteriia bacterium]
MEIRYESNRPRNIFISLLVNTLSILLASYLLTGVHVASPTKAIIVAAVLALLNVTLKPLLIILTLPLTLFSFGLFLFVINAIVIYVAADWIDGFGVDSFWWAVFFSLLISFINSVLYKFGEKQRD